MAMASEYHTSVVVSIAYHSLGSFFFYAFESSLLLTRCCFVASVRSVRLDDAELALYGRDKDKKGELSKEQLHSLMQENLEVKKQLGTVKKFVIG